VTHAPLAGTFVYKKPTSSGRGGKNLELGINDFVFMGGKQNLKSLNHITKRPFFHICSGPRQDRMVDPAVLCSVSGERLRITLELLRCSIVLHTPSAGIKNEKKHPSALAHQLIYKQESARISITFM
jgi:hypothetical protein